MELVPVLERVAGVDLASADRAAVSSMFTDLARLTAWIEARRVAGMRRLVELADTPFPEAAVVEATREPARDALRLQQRTATLDVFGRFAKALEAGEINTAHIDHLTHALADLPPERRDAFVAAQDPLLDTARHAAPERFARAVRDVVTRVLSREDATSRSQRQRRATALATWTNKATGMWHLRGQFDPETGTELLARLESARQQLFPDPTILPETCPIEPGERDDHLRALTLAHLLLGDDTPGWRPETLLVVDEHTVEHGHHDHSIVDAGADIDLAHEAIQRLAARGRAVRVTMRDGVVTSVDGRADLDRGRSTRLADLDQRRALRAMYPCCAIPDCPVRFRHCRIHHLEPWDPTGPTDLPNLLPLCSRHHHHVHNRGWALHLDPVSRVLTVTRPDGTVTRTPPPYAFAS